MMYLAKLKKKKNGFTMDKAYKVIKDFYDIQAMNWYVIQKDDGEKTLIHRSFVNVIGFDSGDKNEAIHLS